MPDHVHMLISIPPKYAVSQSVGSRSRPRKPLWAAHKRKPPALPGDCYSSGGLHYSARRFSRPANRARNSVCRTSWHALMFHGFRRRTRPRHGWSTTSSSTKSPISREMGSMGHWRQRTCLATH